MWRRVWIVVFIVSEGFASMKKLFVIGILFLVASFSWAETGLDFPGTSAVIRFKFANPQNIGLPIYGPSGRGVTYIWKVYPRQKAGYYTTFFWGNDDNYIWDNGGANTYYGAHPYPQPPGVGSTAHKWEVSCESADFLGSDVVYNQWYIQALRVWSDSVGKHHEFYWDLPKTDSGHLITHTAATSYGNTNPPNPSLCWGDSQFDYFTEQEMYSGIIRGIQIYNVLLSVNDILSEITTPLSTSAGTAGIWYLNLNPTPTDISDKSGAGHNPAWDGSGRPALYTSTDDTTPPAPPRNLRVE